MNETIKENVGYCKVNCKGSIHNGAEGTVIKVEKHPNWNTVLVCINTGVTQGQAVWLNETNIVWCA